VANNKQSKITQHKPFLVGFDIAKIAGLEEDESFSGFEIKQWWVQHLEHMQSTCNGTRSTAWDKHRICRRPLARNTICTSAIIHLYYLTD